jgi:cytidylate kinase
VTDPLVTIGGPPGSGKSTAGRAVAERRHLEFVSAGQLFRAEARRRGLSLAELGTLAETDDTIDRNLDDEMLRLARPGLLLDGRVTGPLCRRRGISAYYVVVTADPDVRYRRLAGRDGGEFDDVARLTKAREESERRRYTKYYGIDPESERADLTVDSTNGTPDEVVGAILDFLASAPGHPE